MTGQQTASTRDQVIARIADLADTLKPFEDLLLHDSGYGEEHYLWAAAAPLAEVLRWCRLVRSGVPVDDAVLQCARGSLSETDDRSDE